MEWYRAQLEVRKPTVEKWPPDNTYVNHWKIDTTMLFAPGRVQNVSEIEFMVLLWGLYERSVLALALTAQPQPCCAAMRAARSAGVYTQIPKVDTQGIYPKTRSLQHAFLTVCIALCSHHRLPLQRLFKDLLPLMEEWSGTKLKSTACYGVRNYFRDSVLANHVDRVDTHVISGIINVEQVVDA